MAKSQYALEQLQKLVDKMESSSKTSAMENEEPSGGSWHSPLQRREAAGEPPPAGAPPG